MNTGSWTTLGIVIYTSLAHANYRNHLKPCPNKTTSTNYPAGIDFMYVINLDTRPEKWAYTLKQLKPFDIRPYRFSAVNGWELTQKAIQEIGVKYQPGMTQLIGASFVNGEEETIINEQMYTPGKTYFCQGIVRGPIGIALSHLSVIQDAYDSGYETVWVMEDDISVHRSPLEISHLINELDHLTKSSDWDLLFTDPDSKDHNGQYIPCMNHAERPNFTPMRPERFQERIQISPDFSRIGARYGTYSYIIRRSGMKKLLDFFDVYDFFLPIDMEIPLSNDIIIYTLNYDLVSTDPQAFSDNGRPGYLDLE